MKEKGGINMITLAMLCIITAILLVVAFFTIAVGGTVFMIFAADLVVALGIIWFLFFRKKKVKTK